MFFANPAGLWALLGIPAVLAIHFLQRRAKVVTISTLFLLEQVEKQSVKGSRFERLRNSAALWLQLLAVALLAWLLADPMWIRHDSAQKIAIVADASASMDAYRGPALEAIRKELEELRGAAARAEYAALTTETEGEPIYRGSDLDALMAALEAGWKPRSGEHDFAGALRLARSLVGEGGLVVLATDHAKAENPPYAARTLSVGEPMENVGFAGLSVFEKDGQTLWKALVRNYGTTPQTRQWRVAGEGKQTDPQSVTLEPGGATAIQGPFPEGIDEAALVLAEDAFPLDDAMPIRRPAPKALLVHHEAGTKFDPIFKQITGSYDAVSWVAEPERADIQIVAYNPLNPALPEGDAVVFAEDPKAGGAGYFDGNLVEEALPLMEGLNWQGLIARKGIAIPPKDGDGALLWQGARPMIFLRRGAATGGGRQLIFNFDAIESNAARLPAFAILLYRYFEEVRGAKVAEEAGNYECGQPLQFAFRLDADAPPLTLEWQRGTGESAERGSAEIPLSQARFTRAPESPAHFTLRQGEATLIRGSAHFADAREADLSKSAPFNDVAGQQAAIIESNAEPDSLWQLWLVLLVAALAASWWFVEKPEPGEAATDERVPG